MLRGTASGLQFVFGGADFGEAWEAMAQQLAERPSFYRASQATAVFDDAVPDEAGFAAFLSALEGYGIELHGIYGGETFSSFVGRSASAIGFGRTPSLHLWASRQERCNTALTWRTVAIDRPSALSER